MGKRVWSLILSIALVGGVFAAAPARAQQASPVSIPAVVQLDDPVDDANYLNDQSLLTNVPATQDHPTPADGGAPSDLMKIWYSADATTISVNIQTQLPAPAGAGSYIYRVYSNPGEGSVTSSTLGCLRFFVFMPSATPPAGGYSGPQHAGLLDYCDKGMSYTTDIAQGDLKITELPDGTGVMTVTVPRSYSPKLADGQVLTAPQAQVQNLIGTGTDGNGQPLPPTDGSVPSGNWRRGPQIDNTIIGTDWTITGGAPALAPGKPVKPAKPTPPGKNDPPGKGKKKGCDNGKGQKKGACPAPKPSSSCPAYVPGAQGAAAPTALVTAAATEAKPLEVPITAPAGNPATGPSTFHNIQVDAAAAEAGLFVRYEFAVQDDHDIYLNYADGTEAAHAGGFNPAPFVPANDVQGTDGTGSGGHSEQGAEQLDGIRTSDCGGYTLQMDSYLSQGGETTLKLWLGEPENDPAAPAARMDSEALSTFFAMTGIVNPSVARSDSSAQASGTPAGNKGCKKGGGKKTGCKKPPVACSPFVPGEAGTDKPLVTLTDAATEAAPVEQKVNLEASLGDADLVGELPDEGPLASSSDFFNIQIDSTQSQVGVYALFEFPDRRDYDLELLNTDGSYAARSHDFNPICETPQLNCSNEGHGGEAGAAFEKLVGIATQDCGGWTVEAVNWLGEGGEMTVKLWLGEVVHQPQAPGAEPHA